jgi:photosystem II stability/assembly factor-like uncharacterized protein
LKISVLFKCAIVAFSLFLLAQINFAQGVWSPVHRPGNGDLVSVYFTSSDRGFVGGDGGFFAFTTDGGGNWTKQNINSNENVNEIYFRNDDNGYLLVGHKIYISRDSGNSWRENVVVRSTEYNGLTPEFLSIRFSGKKKGWIVGSLSNKQDEVVDSLLLHTEDSGETWTRVIVPAKQELYHVDFVNDESGWIVGADGLVLQTQDEGRNWVKQTVSTTESLYNVDFRDSKNGTVVGGKGTILRTENGGMTWDKISLNIPKPPSLLRVSFINDKTGWIVGGSGTILRTDDKGKSWVSQNTLGKESLYGLYIDKKDGWAVGKKGIILKYIK